LGIFARSEVRKAILLASGMLWLLLYSTSGHANITVQNTATYHPERRADRWHWSIYLKGSPPEISEIRCVTYHLDPTFPYPDRRKCYDNTDSQHAFVLETDGWGFFTVYIDALFMDGTVLRGQHTLSFAAPISPATLLSGGPRLSEEQQEIRDLKRRVTALENGQASATRQDIANLAAEIAVLVKKLGGSSELDPENETVG
jgi:hypothetical protein